MPNTHTENTAIINPLVTRKNERVMRIDAPTFWLNDVGEKAKQIEIALVSNKDWLKLTQPFGSSCTVYPIDGNGGVFEDPPPVSNPDDFIIENGKRAGGCDVLVVNDTFWFVELKLNATSKELPQIAENYQKATLQSGRTLTYFKEKTPENTFNAQNCICMIGVPPSFPELSQISPTIQRKFIKKYNTNLTAIRPNKTIELDQ